MSGLGVKDFLGVGVGVGEGHFVGGDFNVGAVAGGNADVAAGILDVDGGVGWNLRVEELLVVVVLGQAEGVEEVVALIAELGAEGAPPVVPTGGAKADDGEQDEDADKAAAAVNGNLAARVQSPLAEQGQAGADEQQGPPVGVPGPELAGGDVAGDHQEGDDADADEDDGADHGGYTRDVGAAVVAGFPGVTLGPHGIALGAPGGFLLFAVDAPLGPGIVRRIRGRRRAATRRCVGRNAAHDWPPLESSPKSWE